MVTIQPKCARVWVWPFPTGNITFTCFGLVQWEYSACSSRTAMVNITIRTIAIGNVLSPARLTAVGGSDFQGAVLFYCVFDRTR